MIDRLPPIDFEPDSAVGLWMRGMGLVAIHRTTRGGRRFVFEPPCCGQRREVFVEGLITIAHPMWTHACPPEWTGYAVPDRR